VSLKKSMTANELYPYDHVIHVCSHEVLGVTNGHALRGYNFI